MNSYDLTIEGKSELYQNGIAFGAVHSLVPAWGTPTDGLISSMDIQHHLLVYLTLTPVALPIQQLKSIYIFKNFKIEASVVSEISLHDSQEIVFSCTSSSVFDKVFTCF